MLVIYLAAGFYIGSESLGSEILYMRPRHCEQSDARLHDARAFSAPAFSYLRFARGGFFMIARLYKPGYYATRFET